MAFNAHQLILHLDKFPHVSIDFSLAALAFISFPCRFGILFIAYFMDYSALVAQEHKNQSLHQISWANLLTQKHLCANNSLDIVEICCVAADVN